MGATEPQLLTPGRLAELLNESLSRVQYVLRTRKHIRPYARAGTLRLYDSSTVVELVRQELQSIDARRTSKQPKFSIVS